MTRFGGIPKEEVALRAFRAMNGKRIFRPRAIPFERDGMSVCRPKKYVVRGSEISRPFATVLARSSGIVAVSLWPKRPTTR